MLIDEERKVVTRHRIEMRCQMRLVKAQETIGLLSADGVDAEVKRSMGLELYRCRAITGSGGLMTIVLGILPLSLL